MPRQEQVTQPDLPRSIIATETILDWAGLRRSRVNWLRYVCPQLVIDSSKQILGELLDTITGDDINVFAWAMFKTFDPYIGLDSQQALLERLDLEITAPEVPASIKSILRRLQFLSSNIDWKDPENFQLAQRAFGTACDCIRQIISKSGKLQEVITYSRENASVLIDHWINFLAV